MTWVLSALSIRGVKGVLDRAGEFGLSPKKGQPRSIAIFGRNGQGKSGYADAVEYLFSPDGEVEHLGKGSADSEQGGKHAIPHVLAAERGITPEINADFVELETRKKFTVRRAVVTGRNDSRPGELENIVQRAPAHRILRQHDLRRFVVDMPPSEKFNEFARWIGLEKATTILSHLTTTERTLKETDVDREIAEREMSIDSHTSGVVTTYDLPGIFAWCRQEVRKHTGQELRIASPPHIENALELLRQHREQVVLKSQTAKEFAAKSSLEKETANLVATDGPLAAFSNALAKTQEAEQIQDQAKEKASQSVFKEVWEKASKVIEEENPETCPVCLTPWTNTAQGTVENVLVNLRNSLDSLSHYNAAHRATQRQRQQLTEALGRLEQSFASLENYAKELTLNDVSGDLVALKSLCVELKPLPERIGEITGKLSTLSDGCRTLAREQIPNTLAKRTVESSSTSAAPVDKSISHLEGLRESILRLQELKRQQHAIRTVEAQFHTIAGILRREIRTMADNAVGLLRSDVEKIYKQVHPGQAVPRVFIDLDTTRKALVVRIGFYSPDRRVPPGGYLSEAQINTLGLALFLSSVKLFNAEFPFVFLDDIVSSYDADSRARIVDVLANHMSDFQIFLTTHDERFYTHLTHRLEGENWKFEKITGYDFESGPRRISDGVRPTQVDELIDAGEPHIAGNAVRQYMEEWLDKMCEKYEVHTLHKRDSRDYQRTLFDFWQPFMARAEKLGAGFGQHVLGSECCQKLKGSPLINYYSHHQANPYEWSAMGDVKYIWEEFQDFSSLFCCHSCRKLLRYDPSDSRLYCTCGKPILPTA